MSFDTRRSLLTWQRKAAYRKARHRFYELRGDRRGMAKWSVLLKQARDRVQLRKAQLTAKPRIVDLHLEPNGPLEPQPYIKGVVGHYTAGPVDRDDAHCAQLFRSVDRQHKNQGWTMIGYEFGLSAKGTIYLLRPATKIGAHVLGHNTGNVGVVCNGTTGDKPTAAQAKAFRWLLHNAHTTALPKEFRVDLRGLTVKGHNDLGPTACPGKFKTMYVSKGARR